jgi:hypothetical protein
MDPGEIVNTGIIAIKYGAAGIAIPCTALARRILGPAADEVAQILTDQIRMYRYARPQASSQSGKR